MFSILLGVALVASGGMGSAQGAAAQGRVAGCPATYKAAKALRKGAPRIVQGGRQPGDEAYATFSEYAQARPTVLGATATGMLIHTPRGSDTSEVGRVVFRLPGLDRDRYLPAFVSVYGERNSDGEAHPDGDDEIGTLNEASLDDGWGPFAVFKRDTVYLVCLYNY